MAVCLFPRVQKIFYWVGGGLLAVTIAGVVASPTLAQEGEAAPPSDVRRVDQVSGSDFSVS